jgi:hypothetical protein
MSQYDDLIAGQYAAVIQYLEQVGGSYFGGNFTLSQTPTKWLLKLGRYKGNLGHGPIDLHGYWIFRTDVNMCWQAVGGGGAALAYWNQDGRAQGNPENWELFQFLAVDPAQQTVKIQGISGELNHGGCFVTLVGGTFLCNDRTNGTVFKVGF